MPQRNWRKIGTNRSKNGKVIYRRFDMSEQRGCHVPGFIVTSALPPLTRAAATPAVRRIGDASGIRNGPHGSKPYSTPRAAPHAERRPHGPGPGCGSGKVQGAERSVAHRAPHFYAADPLSCGAAPERSGTGSREASNTTTRSAMLSPRPARMCGQRSRLRRSTGQRQLNNFGCLEISAKSGAITATETQADCEADGYISIRAGLLANVTLSTDNVAKARVTVPQSGLPPWPNALHLGPIQ
jgi:hypothetical protein